ncbi:uncharacterized protein Z519_00674 [Cladophialophora bantiana CBS 173.52]|uniref:Zn(2)-C6 fungal-type domain-containing protein n=1 Tax=Cladophialophora bantiana (strain ATCC 10958 / CBS 173.52 / CDC B-1940 / NIH 8579) TaxID=1442370 RepID=A0A0D2FAC6_CLAB1|nr:uncharacterized protein Z519_00674 [Cladophialophora bantiana CBS 173.52]KIW99011.1 hypothetical protein Z519_00674 [Cladophialophora bantiana CBS 173.52]
MSQRTGLSPSNVSEASTSSQPSVAQPSSSGETTSPEARKYVTQACQPCRAKRSKCDNAHPTCSACVGRGTLCVYSDVDRRRGKLRANETDALQERVRKFESTINTLTHGSDEEAYELLRRMRTNPPQSPGSDGLAEWTQVREKDVEFNTLAARVYTVNDLPPENLILYGIRAYFNYTYTLLYIYEKQEIDDILNRVYRTHEAVDNATLCELCALAAVGSHYEGDKFDGPVMEALFHTATIYMSDCIESQFLRGMRVILCLGIISSMTKRASARLSISSGLRLARWARLQQQDILPRVAYRKVYRSLVFMECWLASSLGYEPDLNNDEAEFTRQEIIEPQPTTENRIQAEICTVGLMMAGILLDVYKSSSVVFAIVEKHSRILGDWQEQLPDSMRLDALVPGHGNGYSEPERRALIFVHITFLGAKMMLQKRLLVEMANCRMKRRWTLDGTLRQGESIQGECVEAAELCVHLLDILGYTRHKFRRCWLCIGHAFSACSVLLFAAAQRLLYDQRDKVEGYLAKSQECIKILVNCSVVDRVANSLLQIVRPLHQDLQRLASTESSSRPKSGIYDLLENPHADGTSTPSSTASGRGWSPVAQQYQGSSSEFSVMTPTIRSAAIPAMQNAIEVLANPFGHSRRLSHTDSFVAGDPNVPRRWN